jgi:cytochrome c oxidase subunit I+III
MEWLPSGLYSTRSIPVVTSRQPLWDDDRLSSNVEEGRYFLPRSVTGLRETILTSPVNAVPQQLLILPGPSPWPITAGVFTSGFFLLLTVQGYVAALISGILAILAILIWLWETDRPVALQRADIGAGIHVPTHGEGLGNHGVWATITLLVVFGMIFVMALFSLAFLWTNQHRFWIDPPKISSSSWVLGLAVVAFLLSLIPRVLLRRTGRISLSVGVIVLAPMLSAAATLLDMFSWQNAFLFPNASGQGAIVYGMMAHQASLVAVCLIMAAYTMVRAMAGHISHGKSVLIDICTLVMAYTCAQGLVGAIVPRLLVV